MNGGRLDMPIGYDYYGKHCQNMTPQGVLFQKSTKQEPYLRCNVKSSFWFAIRISYLLVQDEARQRD